MEPVAADYDDDSRPNAKIASRTQVRTRYGIAKFDCIISAIRAERHLATRSTPSWYSKYKSMEVCADFMVQRF